MSNYEIDIFSSGKEKSITTHADILRTNHNWIPSNNYLLANTLWKTYEAPEYNFVINTFYQTNVFDTSFEFVTRTLKLKIECAEERRGFFIKIPNTIKPHDTTETIKTESLILCCAHQNGTQYPISCPYFSEGQNTRYTTFRQNGDIYPTELGDPRTRTARLFVLSPNTLHEYVYEKLTGDSVAGGINHHNLTTEEKADVYNKLLDILNGVTYTLSDNTIDIQEFRSFRDGQQFNVNDFGMLGHETYQLATYEQLPLPIFDYTQTDDILRYINTGDKSGALDVFDNENPKAKHIEDWKTNVQVFISPEESDKKKTHLTIVAYNNDLINNFDTIEDNVRLHTVVHGATAGGQAFFAPMGKYPTQNLIVSNFPDNRNIDIYSGLYMDNPFTTSWYFGLHLKKKDTSAVHCAVDFVTHSEAYPQTTIQAGIVKTQIVDGYRYTDTNTGEWIEVIFRAITLDDLNDYKYKNPEDNEDDQSGTDGTFTTGGGLRTYSITKEMFNTINNSLWSTDWTSVFKSTTVNPISCVIACKAIPFTAPTSGTDTVMIANMNSGVTASYVTPVKSFAVGSVNIPAYAGDFTDITLTHIRCYLPYIGWVELPASECIERVAYPTVGIEARHKHLSFKYVVDFVDGAVRCVVSVNGTERWYFDGNCSIDVPVTSDNHTQAVSNAIRSGVQTGLSIVTAVAGAYAGNAGAVAGGVMGAMQSAPNIFPTYSFTATSNGSGYINASMNQHIMLVIEHPNVIRSADYAKRVGVPCGLSLNLGSLHGYTRCVDVNVTGIDATPNEIQRIKSMLESGVYL